MTDQHFNWLQWRVRNEWGTLDQAELKEWLTEAARRSEQETEDRSLIQAGDLLLANWRPEPDRPSDPMMSWRWRRPGPRGGRLFLSTDQAFNALQRAGK